MKYGRIDQLATRGVNGPTNCPTRILEELPEDSEREDGPEMKNVEPVITQDDEWDEDEHLPTFGMRVDGRNAASEEDRAQKQAIVDSFSRDVLGNSSMEAGEDDSEIMANPDSNTIITGAGEQVMDAEGSDPLTMAEHRAWGNYSSDRLLVGRCVAASHSKSICGAGFVFCPCRSANDLHRASCAVRPSTCYQSLPNQSHP
jgi:hypothetical protein